MAPGSDEPVAPTPPERVGLRTHPLTGLVQGAIWTAAVVVGLVSSSLSGGGWGDIPIWVSLLIAVVGGLVVGEALGFLTWWFTRYVIDGTELRINSGILTKASRRIPYERIQSVDIAEPLLARLFGLAELRIEMAGGKNSRSSLRFLPLAEARVLRRLLLDRAHGRPADTELDADASPETDESQRELIAIVSPERVIIGTALSLDFLFAVVALIVVLVTSLWFDQVIAFVGGFFALGSWLAQIVGKRVLQQWGFTLSRDDRGLRIERGLLSRTSQTIPFDRVQGVAIEEPYVWRRLGWQRLEVDVAGYAGGSDDSSTGTSSTLLPISDPQMAAYVLDQLVPDARPEEVARVRVPSRGWWFAPIGWRYRWIGSDDRAFVARSGWIQRTTDVVPHHKTQSVAVRQGPLQRIRRVATLDVHTPKGPVDADGRHLDQADARRELFAQLARARAARFGESTTSRSSSDGV